ncbi:hypothetical protein [Streptomyces adelaidensis]|uniref:hypothetical protein n=1 Tax=Streptomyces adelaidensis TaxID=2796465 RepID=UPI001906608C|nr:hypothetical protein [Streptomyces adelaidensis]
MSRMAQIIVLARYEDEVMEPLTRYDEARTWRGRFEQIPGWFVGGWYIEFFRRSQRSGVLKDLESLPWNSPECVQVMLHDEDDDCFGLWMFRDGVLAEVEIPGTRRFHAAPPPWLADSPDPGVLFRTGQGGTPAEHSTEHVQDPCLSW